MICRVIVPDSFIRPPFFVEGDALSFQKCDTFLNLMQRTYFLFEIASAQQLGMNEPWREQEKCVPAVQVLWKGKQDELTALFRERKRTETQRTMIQYAAHFLSMLYWMNSEQITSLLTIEHSIQELSYMPVNVSERISFVMERPDHYHSFIQLSQLYEEAEKLFYKIQAVKKTSSK